MTPLPDSNGLVRCPWPKQDPIYLAYHDDEWGVPERDDRTLYEKLMLDGFQAGLSWITILRKRDNFRRAFDGFVPERIARYDQRKVTALMNDAGIVRNRAKIEGTVQSARAWLALQRRRAGDVRHVGLGCCRVSAGRRICAEAFLPRSRNRGRGGRADRISASPDCRLEFFRRLSTRGE